MTQQRNASGKRLTHGEVAYSTVVTASDMPVASSLLYPVTSHPRLVGSAATPYYPEKAIKQPPAVDSTVQLWALAAAP